MGKKSDEFFFKIGIDSCETMVTLKPQNKLDMNNIDEKELWLFITESDNKKISFLYCFYRYLRILIPMAIGLHFFDLLMQYLCGK